MKIVKILYILVFLVTAGVFGQGKNLPEAFDVKNDTVSWMLLPDINWQYYLEKEPLTIEQVSSDKYDGLFKANDATNKSYSDYWLRFRLKNSLNKPVVVTIPGFKKTHIYISGKNNTWQHSYTGFYVAWSRRDGLKKVSQIAYTLAPGKEITVYLHDSTARSGFIYAVIGTKDKLIEDFYINNEGEFNNIAIYAVICGFLIFAALFNLFFYNVIKEKVYLIYSITLVLVAFMLFSDGINYLLFSEYPDIYMYFYAVVVSSGICMGIITILLFIGVNRHHPLLYKTFFILSIFCSATLLFYYIHVELRILKRYDAYFDALLQWVTLILIGGILAVALTDWYKKRRSAGVFILAALPFLVSFVIQVFNFDFLPAWFSDLVTVTILWAVVVISWSLFIRYKGVLNENMEQSLEKERILREKEEERNELIARQNEVLEEQVAQRTAQLQQSLEDLKTTQDQLIQSEKMASLGELTAGIAHEIQNPLNFVNNFSDVSVELLQELKEEVKAGNTDEVLAISSDLKQNLEKIAHHGRRADGIVKGMLQHSRASSGQKEPVDINALADEYLRLAYHGLRAKDKSFNAELVTNFAEGLPKIKVIPQDMGRVLLNLFTNAFYATQERSRQAADGSYKPAVEVATKQQGSTVIITVKDNGTGIPDAIKDKILQPFFTTKPTGEGTGLGLSLSYDIVVKGHSGTINIESSEGQGATFIITLPII